MNIAVVGTGYVGLVSGTCFADSGNNVICVDNNQKKLAKLNNKEIPIYEPGLNTLFKRSVREDRLTFTSDLKDAVQQSEIVFLCLPTPPNADGQADLSFVLQVAEELGPMLNNYKVIVNKSTVPVGTADKVRAKIKKTTEQEFDVVSNPEFLREGAAVDDFLKPERVVIGSRSEKAVEKMQLLYEPFVRSGNPIIVMDERSAELTKYAANSLLATKITFMNEIANICERVGANVDNIRRGIGTDSRIGKRFLFAGIGYGGSCFPKDVQAIHYTAGEYGYDFEILDSVMKVNHQQKVALFPKIEDFYKGDLSEKTIAVWGLSFKPETDDTREAPAIYLIRKLIESGAHIKAYDPEASKNFKIAIGDKYNDNITYVRTQSDALKGSDSLVICTDWNEFKRPDFDTIHKLLREPVIFDGRNLYDLERIEKANIQYFSIGRPNINIEDT